MSISVDFSSDSNSDDNDVDYIPDSFGSGSDSDFSVNCDLLSKVCP